MKFCISEEHKNETAPIGKYMCFGCGKFYDASEMEYTAEVQACFDNRFVKLFIFKCPGCASYRAEVREISEIKPVRHSQANVPALARNEESEMKTESFRVCMTGTSLPLFDSSDFDACLRKAKEISISKGGEEVWVVGSTSSIIWDRARYNVLESELIKGRDEFGKGDLAREVKGDS